MKKTTKKPTYKRTKKSRSRDPQNYKAIKVSNQNFETKSAAIRTLLLRKKGNLESTKAHKEIAKQCNVSYPCVYQLAREILQEVTVREYKRKENVPFDSVLEAATALSETKVYTMEQLAVACKVSLPCMERIVKIKKLDIAD